MSIDGVAVGVGGAGAAITGGVLYAGVVQGDQVAGVFDIGVRRQGRGPGDTTIAGAESAEATVGNAEVRRGQSGDRLTEGNGNRSGFTNRQCSIAHHDACGRTLSINGVVVGVGGTAACVTGRIGIPGVVQGNEVIGVFDIGVRCQRGRPGNTAITGAESAETTVGNAEVRRGQSGDRLTEGNGDRSGFTSRQRSITYHDTGRWALGIDGVVVGVGGTTACVTGRIGIPRVVQGNEITGVFDIGVRCQGRCPGNTAITGAESAETTIGNAEVRRGQSSDRLTKGDGDRSGFTSRQRSITYHDTGRWALGIDGVAVGVSGTAAGIARQVSHPGIVQGNEVAGIFDIGVRRQGRGPGNTTIAGTEAAKAAIGYAEIGRVQPAYRLTEGNGNRGGFASRQCGITYHDTGRWALGIDGVVVGVGGASTGVASSIDIARVVQGNQITGVFDIGIRRQGCRPGDAAITGTQSTQGAIGDSKVTHRQATHRLTEGDGHRAGFTYRQCRIADHDAGGRTLGIDGVAVGVGGAATGITGGIGIPRVVQGNQIAGVFDIGIRCQGRCPGDTTIYRHQLAQGAIGDGKILDGQATHRLTEGDGDCSGFADR